VVLSGAGISTDSGIPDFRGPKGVWTKNPQAEKASNIRFWLSDPEVRKAGWEAMCRERARPQRSPNAGHRALLQLEKRGVLKCLVTQNVDGLHTAAGSSPAMIIEVHGSVKQTRCLDCGDLRPIGTTLDRVEAGEVDPKCDRCGGQLKRATISFGQALVTEDLERAMAAADDCDVLLAVGSTLSVFPVAEMVPRAHASGARIIIVNQGETEFDNLADVKVDEDSISSILPYILRFEGDQEAGSSQSRL